MSISFIIYIVWSRAVISAIKIVLFLKSIKCKIMRIIVTHTYLCDINICKCIGCSFPTRYTNMTIAERLTLNWLFLRHWLLTPARELNSLSHRLQTKSVFSAWGLGFLCTGILWVFKCRMCSEPFLQTLLHTSQISGSAITNWE